MRGKIIRLDKNQHGTFGVFTLNGEAVCLTLENRWVSNQKDISCIPEDIYIAQRHDSPQHGNTFKLLNVPGRTDILFHIGNTHEETKGCILLGSKFGELKGVKAVLSSYDAFTYAMQKLEGINQFPLQIISV